MKQISACDGSTYIDGDSGIISQKKGDVAEYFLRHGVAGAYIKHVNGSVRVKSKVA